MTIFIYVPVLSYYGENKWLSVLKGIFIINGTLKGCGEEKTIMWFLCTDATDVGGGLVSGKGGGKKMSELKFDGIDDYVEVPEKGKWKTFYPFGKVFPRMLSEEEVLQLLEGKVKPLKCRKCNFWFMSRSELMYHIWSRHRKKLEKNVGKFKCVLEEVMDTDSAGEACDRCPFKRMCVEREWKEND